MVKLQLLILALLAFCSPTFSQQNQDIRNILEACLNMEELQAYYHPELENRVPIIIQDDELIPEVNGIVMFDKEVEFWLLEDIFFQGLSAYIIVTKFEYETGKASIKFRYHIEGIKVEATLGKVKDQWHIQESKINKL